MLSSEKRRNVESCRYGVTKKEPLEAAFQVIRGDSEAWEEKLLLKVIATSWSLTETNQTWVSWPPPSSVLLLPSAPSSHNSHRKPTHKEPKARRSRWGMSCLYFCLSRILCSNQKSLAFNKDIHNYKCITSSMKCLNFTYSLLIKIWCLSIQPSLSQELTIPDLPTTTINSWICKWSFFPIHETWQWWNHTQYAQTYMKSLI